MRSRSRGRRSRSNGTAAVNPDGRVTYTPAPAITGSDSFSYTVSDGRGGSATGHGQRHRAQPTAPLAGADSATTDAGTPVTHRRARQRQRPRRPRADCCHGGAAAGGSALANPDGTITYTPAMGFLGTDSFTYTISDGHGGAAGASVAVEVRATATSEPFSDGTYFTDGTGWTPVA